MAIIALEGMHFFAHHGVFPEEQLKGNNFEADVWLDTGNSALPTEDKLHETLDYGKVYEIVEQAMKDRANLLETLVERIGKGCLECFPELVSVKVRVSKFGPPVAGRARRSYVEDVFRQ